MSWAAFVLKDDRAPSKSSKLFVRPVVAMLFNSDETLVTLHKIQRNLQFIIDL